MEALTIHPRNKAQLNALKVIFKEMKIPFEKAKNESCTAVAGEESPYDPEFVKEILKAKKDIEAGKGKAIKTEDLWK